MSYRNHETQFVTSSSLLELFNTHLFDFVQSQGEGRYTGCDWPENATHKLEPTSWDKEEIDSGRYALSVALIPISETPFDRSKLASVKIKRPLPKDRSAYKKAGSLEGRRAVVKEMIEFTGAKIGRREIAKADSIQLHRFYCAIVNASLLF